MPIYEYMCETHGPFEQMRPMAEFAAPCDCPSCGKPAPRVLLTAPRLGASDRAGLRAHAVNEQAADSPKRASSHTSGHGPGCSCCSGKKIGSGALRRPDGSKSFPANRPWMISH